MQRQRSVPVVFYQAGGDRWLAQCLGVDVVASGRTLDEVKSAVIEALEQYFEDGDEQVIVGEIHVETVVV